MTDSLLNIPGYTVHGLLGKGGMAEVYLATQHSLQRKVAVKVLLNSSDQNFNTRFIQEGYIVASLNNPSIITIYDINRLDDGRYYMAMEFVPGGDLAQQRGEVFPPERALTIVRQIASALLAVHGKGLVHRDIKPANILFRHDGTAVLTDFGIAKDVEIDSDLTQAGISVGSPAYSSPEQTQCHRLDARSDIYSLGLILLEMLTGNNPYRGSNYTQTALNQVQMPVPVLPEHLAMFQPVLEHMLVKDPAQRIADAATLLAELALIEAGNQAASQLLPARISPSALTVDRPNQLQRPASGNRWMKNMLAVLGGLLAFFALGAGGMFLYQQKQIFDTLGVAEARLTHGQLIAPAQDSAEYYFQQVLLLDADNQQAREGLQRILDLRVADYLQLAQAGLSEQRLLLPESDNAVFYYRQALELDPTNEQAQAGLQQIVESYRDKARTAYQKGKFPEALSMIERGLQVQPDNQQLLDMRKEHQAFLASSRAAREERRQRQASAGSKASQQRSQATSDSPVKSIENSVKRVWNTLFGD